MMARLYVSLPLPGDEMHEIDSSRIPASNLRVTPTKDNGTVAERAFSLRAALDNFSNKAAYSRVVESFGEAENKSKGKQRAKKVPAPSCRSRLNNDTLEVRYEVSRDLLSRAYSVLDVPSYYWSGAA